MHSLVPSAMAPEHPSLTQTFPLVAIWRVTIIDSKTGLPGPMHESQVDMQMHADIP